MRLSRDIKEYFTAYFNSDRIHNHHEASWRVLFFKDTSYRILLQCALYT